MLQKTATTGRRSVKFDKQDNPDSKRHREDTLSSQGSSCSLGASMVVDE